jgi:hypothetical protein
MTGAPLFRRVASWLDESPTKKVAVAAAAIIAFVLSLLNGGWTIWKEYRALKQVPRIHIASRTSYHLTAPVAVEQVLGAFQTSTKKAPRIATPYFPVVLELSNPTNRKTSLSHCSLTVGFLERQVTHESFGYMTPQALKTSSFEKDPVLPVESGETRHAELLFFLLPTPELETLLNDKTTQPVRFQVTCHNEGGGKIESRVH